MLLLPLLMIFFYMIPETFTVVSLAAWGWNQRNMEEWRCENILSFSPYCGVDESATFEVYFSSHLVFQNLTCCTCLQNLLSFEEEPETYYQIWKCLVFLFIAFLVLGDIFPWISYNPAQLESLEQRHLLPILCMETFQDIFSLFGGDLFIS